MNPTSAPISDMGIVEAEASLLVSLQEHRRSLDELDKIDVFKMSQEEQHRWFEKVAIQDHNLNSLMDHIAALKGGRAF